MSNKLKKMKQVADRRKAAMKPREKQFLYHLDKQTMDEVYELSGVLDHIGHDIRVTRCHIKVVESVKRIPMGNFTGSSPYTISLNHSVMNNYGDELKNGTDVVQVRESDYFELGGFGQLLDDFRKDKLACLLPFNLKYLPQEKFEIVLTDGTTDCVEVPFMNFQATEGNFLSSIRKISIDNGEFALEVALVDKATKLFTVAPALIKGRFADDYTIEYDSSSNNLFSTIALHGYCDHVESNAVVDNTTAFLREHLQTDFMEFSSSISTNTLSKRKADHPHGEFLPVTSNGAIYLWERSVALDDSKHKLYLKTAIEKTIEWTTSLTFVIHNVLTIFAFLYIRQVQCIVSPNSTEHPKVPYMDKSGSISESVIFKLIDQKCVQYIYENNRNPHKGCSSKSPHEREAHMRYYKSGKAVRVKACSINGGVPKNTIIVKSKAS